MAIGPGGGGSPGGFDYNQWASMNLGRGGGGDSPPDTPDDLIKKGIDKTFKTYMSKILGIMNPDIEGKGVIPGETNVGSGLSLTNVGFLGMMRDMPGGILAAILKYFTRDLPQMWSGGEGGSEGGGGGGGGDYASGGGGGGDYSNTASYHAGGGGDFHGHASLGDHAMPESRVSYGGKLLSSDALVADLGNLKPQATPAVSGDRDYGMSV